jgi:hypothetical protein
MRFLDCWVAQLPQKIRAQPVHGFFNIDKTSAMEKGCQPFEGWQPFEILLR